MAASDLVTSAKSSANLLAGARSPEMVLCPTPVAVRAKRRALKTSPISSGDDLSPAFAPAIESPPAIDHRAEVCPRVEMQVRMFNSLSHHHSASWSMELNAFQKSK